MPDDALLLDGGADQEAGHVDQVDEGHVEGVAHAYEARRLVGGVAVEDAALVQRLAGHDACRPAAEASEADHDVPGPGGLDFEPGFAIADRLDHLAHVICGPRAGGDDLLQALDQAVRRILALGERGRLRVAGREIGQESAHGRDALAVVGHLVVPHSRLVAVDLGAAHVVVRDVLAGGGLDQAGAAQRHRAGALDHGHEVGQARDVGGARGAGTEHRRHLRNHARHLDLVVEEEPGAGEGGAGGLLDASPGRVEQPDDGLAVAHRQLTHPRRLELLANLAHGAGHDREVVGDHPDLPAVDLAVAGDHAVGRGLGWI